MKLVLLAALLAPVATPAAAPEAEGARTSQRTPLGTPNLLSAGGAHCQTFAQQIGVENKRLRSSDAHRLDREPPAHMLRAVDRQVEGCRELTFTRRDVAR
jgi:hypothetical protein